MLPSVASFESMNLSGLVSRLIDGRDYVVSVHTLHPSFKCILSIHSALNSVPQSTGYASRLLNALDDSGLCTVLEVSTIVW